MRPSEKFDGSSRLPFREATPKIALDSCRRLISLLGGLREQLHHDCGNGLWDTSYPFAGNAGCLAIWQCTHSIGSDAVNGRLPVSIS